MLAAFLGPDKGSCVGTYVGKSARCTWLWNHENCRLPRVVAATARRLVSAPRKVKECLVILHRVTVFPAPGETADMRAALEEWWGYTQSKGYRISLAQQLFPPTGSVLVAEGLHASLAAWEQWSAAVNADTTWSGHTAKFAQLERAPGRTEVFRLLRPATEE